MAILGICIHVLHGVEAFVGIDKCGRYLAMDEERITNAGSRDSAPRPRRLMRSCHQKGEEATVWWFDLNYFHRNHHIRDLHVQSN
jgi:hypothetical protein